MPRPLIGITSDLAPARWADWVREAAVSPATYARAVARGGGLPVMVPPVSPSGAADIAAGLHGLVFAGGCDIEPGQYGAVPDERSGPYDRNRDRFEIALVRAAIKANVPFLAVGRGLQVLNVACGGTLIQHLPDAVGHQRHAPDPVKLETHDVQIGVSSRVGKILGDHQSVPTGHHQAVNRLGAGLLAVAWADDQIVEAAELQDHPFGVGVQWHPEASEEVPLFAALVAAVREQRPGGAGPDEDDAA